MVRLVLIQDSFNINNLYNLMLDYNSATDKQAELFSKSTPKRQKRHNIFAPASPALSGKVPASTGQRKPSLRPLDTSKWLYNL